MRKHYRRFRITLNVLAAFAIGAAIAKLMSKILSENVNHPPCQNILVCTRVILFINDSKQSKSVIIFAFIILTN